MEEGGEKESEREREDCEIRGWCEAIAERGPWAKECGWQLEVEEGKDLILPRASGRNTALPTLDFSPIRAISDLESY